MLGINDTISNDALHPLLNEGLMLKGLNPQDFTFDEESLLLTDGNIEIAASDLLIEIGSKEIKVKPNKVSTSRPNNTMPGGQAPIRCVGCTVSNGTNDCSAEEAVQINVYYAFDPNYPTAYRQEVQDAFDLYSDIISDKIVFNETSTNPQLTVSKTTGPRSSASLPKITGKIGSNLRMQENLFSSSKDLERRNVLLHEVGHIMGLKHSHVRDSDNTRGANYSTGLGVSKKTSIMSYDYYPFTSVDYLTQGTLPSHDITVLNDLYPYNGSGNTQDNRTCSAALISYLPQALSDIGGIWTLMDVNFDEVVDNTDKDMLTDHILGIELLPADIAEDAGWIDGNNPTLSSQDLAVVQHYINGNPIHDYPTEGHIKSMYDFDGDGSFDYGDELNAIEAVFPSILLSGSDIPEEVTYSGLDWKENDVLLRCYRLSLDEFTDDTESVDYNTIYESYYNYSSQNKREFPTPYSSAMFRDLSKLEVVYGTIN